MSGVASFLFLSFLFGLNKSSVSFGSSRGVLTDICHSFRNRDYACHAGVTKIRVTFSDWTLLNTQSIGENEGKAYPVRCVQEI